MQKNITGFVLSMIVCLFFSSNFLLAQEDNPDKKAGALNKEASKYIQEKDYDQAIESSEQALALRLGNTRIKADTFFNLSSAYLEKGIIPYMTDKDDKFYKKAIDYANKCVKLEPKYWQAYANIATVYMNMKQLFQADVYFEKAKEFANTNSKYYEQMLIQQSAVRRALEQEKKKKTKFK